MLFSIYDLLDTINLLPNGHSIGRDAEDACEMQKARGKRISALDMT